MYLKGLGLRITIYHHCENGERSQIRLQRQDCGTCLSYVILNMSSIALTLSVHRDHISWRLNL